MSVNQNIKRSLNLFGLIEKLYCTENIEICLLAVLSIEILVMWQSYPWYFGEIGCKIAVVFSELVSYVSVGTVFAFTIER